MKEITKMAIEMLKEIKEIDYGVVSTNDSLYKIVEKLYYEVILKKP